MKEKTQLPCAWERSDENAVAPLPRIQRADRQQVDPQPRRLDELIDEDHPARVVWAFVEGLDLLALYERIRAVEGHAGCSAIDARILMALWLYATLDGVGSARQLAKLCQEHNAYRWLGGGVSVNYHTLSDFRVQHGAWLEAKRNTVKVIECNLRASRSFPFVSKITGKNFASEAMRRMLGVSQSQSRESDHYSLDLDYVGVKAPMFSFSRLVGADPMLGVEMTSTGEVGCLGRDLHEALLHGLLATGIRFPQKGILLSLGPVVDKYWFADEARIIAEELRLPIYATEGTAEILLDLGIDCFNVAKMPSDSLSALEVIDDGRVDFVINIPREYDQYGRPDGYLIRRHAVDAGVPLITDLQLARAVIEALRLKKPESLNILAWNDYLGQRPLC